MSKRRKNIASARQPRLRKLHRWHAVLIVFGLLAAAGLFIGTHSSQAKLTYQPRPKGSVTFSKEIAPIIYEQCSGCHRPGQSAPCDLITWRDVRRHAQQIAEITRKKIMPPWLPEPGHEPLLESRQLSADEIGLLGQWAAEGAPEGNPADLPALPKWPEGWELGTPDLVVQMPQGYTVPRTARMFTATS